MINQGKVEVVVQLNIIFRLISRILINEWKKTLSNLYISKALIFFLYVELQRVKEMAIPLLLKKTDWM